MLKYIGACPTLLLPDYVLKDFSHFLWHCQCSKWLGMHKNPKKAICPCTRGLAYRLLRLHVAAAFRQELLKEQNCTCGQKATVVLGKVMNTGMRTGISNMNSQRYSSNHDDDLVMMRAGPGITLLIQRCKGTCKHCLSTSSTHIMS